MNKILHRREEVAALLAALHEHKVPYTLTYDYKDNQWDSTEYWKVEIPDPTKMFNAVIANVYKEYMDV